MARRRSAAVWAVLAVVFGAVSSLVVGLAVNAVPRSWGWAHNWWLLIEGSAGLLAAAVLVAVAQARSPADGAEDGHPGVRVGMPRWSPVAGSNTGTMISARKVIISTSQAADPGEGPSSQAFAVDRPGAGAGGRPAGNLPPRNPAFTGRESVLAEIERQLAGGAVVAVRGLGGMGKSQAALEYAYRMRGTGRYQVTGWVRADSAVTAAEDLAALAPLLGLRADGPAGEVAASVVTALGSRRDWLVVFDNAREPDDLTGMLPGGGGHVLITSRNRAWSGIAVQLDLEVFSRAESVAFLCRRSGRPEPEAAGQLAAELGDLPLAVAVALCLSWMPVRGLTLAAAGPGHPAFRAPARLMGRTGGGGARCGSAAVPAGPEAHGAFAVPAGSCGLYRLLMPPGPGGHDIGVLAFRRRAAQEPAWSSRGGCKTALAAGRMPRPAAAAGGPPRRWGSADMPARPGSGPATARAWLREIFPGQPLPACMPVSEGGLRPRAGAGYRGPVVRGVQRKRRTGRLR